ncbi:MAG: site-specific integrase, partial [Eubacterium sp.]|nr:site-specific integrase [Eubacterium sp.]
MYIGQFIDYLKNERRMSENSLDAYMRDMNHFEKYVKNAGVEDLMKVSNPDVISYLMELKGEGKSPSTVN